MFTNRCTARTTTIAAATVEGVSGPSPVNLHHLWHLEFVHALARKSAVLVQVLLMQITLSDREKLANRRTKDPVSGPVVAQSSFDNRLYGWPLLANGELIRKQVLQRIAGQPAKSCLRISINPPPHHAS
jgi:hypothetical protein